MYKLVDGLIKERLLPRYKQHKLHEPGTLEVIQDYLKNRSYILTQSQIDECRLSKMLLRCKAPYTSVGRQLMALQLLEIYSKVTSDLGTFIYHYLPKTKLQLWPEVGDCRESQSDTEEDMVNRDIRQAYLGTVVEHETPEELCQGLQDNGNCQKYLSKYCDLQAEGKYCGEELGWLLQGQSKVGILHCRHMLS